MLRSSWKRMGEDLLITVEGGKSHIGSVVLAQPYEKNGEFHATLSSLNRLAHKDDVIATMYADTVCRKTGHITVCAAGIHYDPFSERKLQEVMEWAAADLKKLVKEIQENVSANR